MRPKNSRPTLLWRMKVDSSDIDKQALWQVLATGCGIQATILTFAPEGGLLLQRKALLSRVFLGTLAQEVEIPPFAELSESGIIKTWPVV